MADYQRNFLDALAGGYQFGQQIKERREENKLKGLASLAYGTPKENRRNVLAEMAGVSPQFAQAQAKQWNADDDNDRQELVRMARFIRNAPPESQAAAYTSTVLPQLRARGMNAPEWTPETQDTILKTVAALTQYDDVSETPAGLREFNALTQGLSPDDVVAARRVKLGLDGRASSAGYSQVKFTGPDGRERIGVMNGRTGQIDLPDGTSFNPQTGAISQTQGEAPAPTRANLEQDASLANDLIAAGVPEAQVDAFLAQRGKRAQGMAPQQAAAATGGAFVGPSKAEEAFATETAKQQAQMQFAPQAAQQDAQAAAMKTAAEESAKSGAERAKKLPQYQNVMRGLNRIDAALKALDGKFVNTGPIDQYLVSMSKEGQELRAAVGAIQNDMLALTRVPGVGSQSDLEAKIANMKWPDLAYDPTVNQNNLAQLRAFMRDFGGSSGETAPVRRRWNPSTGSLE